MAIHASVGRVTTVRHLMTRKAAATGHYNSELIYIGAVPTIVLEWSVNPQGDLPLVTIPLDPRYLDHLGWEQAEYMYEMCVDDPRVFD